MMNPYPNMMGGFIQQKSPQQMQNEYNQAMQQYQNLYGQYNQSQQLPNNISQNSNIQNIGLTTSGLFRSVSGADEVTESPTALDGSATLFFDFANKVFWSKKYVSGRHEIQAYEFKAINSIVDNKKVVDDEIDLEKELINLEPIKTITDERLDRIEKMIESLISKKISNTSIKSKKNIDKKENIINEI